MKSLTDSLTGYFVTGGLSEVVQAVVNQVQLPAHVDVGQTAVQYGTKCAPHFQLYVYMQSQVCMLVIAM